MTETLWPTEPKILIVRPFTGKVCQPLLPLLTRELGQGRNMFQKEGNELKFGHKGTQIETSVKKLGGKKDKL